MVSTPGSAYASRSRGRGRPRGSRNGSNSLFTPGPSSTGRRGGTRIAAGISSTLAADKHRFGSHTDHGGDKPREERSYLEFHPELDVEAVLQIYDSREIDGVAVEDVVTTPPPPPATTVAPADEESTELQSAAPTINGLGIIEPETNGSAATNGVMNGNGHTNTENSSQTSSQQDSQDQNLNRTPSRRGRPPKQRTKSNSSVKPIPPITFSNVHENERLSLPVPSYRSIKPFELSGTYIDRSMALVGFQETDFYQRPPTMIRNIGIANTDAAIERDEFGMVEYDMDEQDDKWLAAYNAYRRTMEVPPISRELFEVTITKIEKEWHALEKKIPKQTASAAVRKREGADDENEDTKCWICDDGECENSNAIVFCDGCDLAVHQDCYGVPFIPEGQWLCRKCQLLTPRQHANCIFCPNTDGAFKQTTTTRWCHLLCALWIPEVTLQNPVYMEPVEGVERVPKQRWKLSCYICRQRMGACIQCSNKSCYLAFHVTCARRAGLYLKMKAHTSSEGELANGERNPLFDSSLLKAFCDKHVPADWRVERGTDDAIIDAQEFYELTMSDRVWGDSQANALTLPDPNSPTSNRNEASTLPRLTLTLGGKRKRVNNTSTAPRIIWRLPSGAPVVPQILYNTLIESLNKFTVRKIKEYVAEICKYWTLKRESRRDASLVKRTQLETFTSDEVTRRDYSRKGDKLQRRLEFAIRLRHDLDRVRMLCDEVRKREREKLRGAECLKEMVDVVYFPVTPLVRPMLERARQIDSKDLFKPGLLGIAQKMQNREYGTVKSFATDLETTITSAIATTRLATSNSSEIMDADTRAALKASLDNAAKTATRIQKAVQPLLEDAYEKERGLREDPYEKLAGAVEHHTNGDQMDVDAATAEDDDREIVGLPWYTLPFDPEGISLLAEERWMGWDVVRDMSPLSEIGEEELEELNEPMVFHPEETVQVPPAEEVKAINRRPPPTRPKKKAAGRAKRPKFVSKRSKRGVPPPLPRVKKGYAMVEVEDEEEVEDEVDDEEMADAVAGLESDARAGGSTDAVALDEQPSVVDQNDESDTPSPLTEPRDDLSDDSPISPLREEELDSIGLPESTIQESAMAIDTPSDVMTPRQNTAVESQLVKEYEAAEAEAEARFSSPIIEDPVSPIYEPEDDEVTPRAARKKSSTPASSRTTRYKSTSNEDVVFSIGKGSTRKNRIVVEESASVVGAAAAMTPTRSSLRAKKGAVAGISGVAGVAEASPGMVQKAVRKKSSQK